MTAIDTDDLYGLPLQRFVRERDALARAMRAEGRRREAADVARLPKPSVGAWVVNQLVRSNPKGLKSVLEAGDALRAAQTAVIDGRGDGQTLRAATEREREAVDELIGSARDLSGADGPALSPTILDRVADTLHAAAFDTDARALVHDGRLERELRHIGLGGALAGAASPPPATRRPKADAKTKSGARTKPGGKADARTKSEAKAGGGSRSKAEARAEAEAEAEADARAEAEAREAAKQAEAAAEARRAAKQAEAEARRRTDRAERALTRAQERRVRAVQAVEEADEALAAARAESEAAADAHRQARERVSSNQ